MIRDYWKEEWRDVKFDENISDKEKFQVSNYGRLKNCKTDDITLVKEYYINGYQNLPLKQKKNGKQTSRYVHKLVAEHFQERGDGVFVIHLDYDKTNNKVENLKWATKREKEIHQFSNPEYINRPKMATNAKLTETKVKLIKRKLNDPNRRTRLKMIAKQFGVTTMQLHRIKTGENWGHVSE